MKNEKHTVEKQLREILASFTEISAKDINMNAEIRDKYVKNHLKKFLVVKITNAFPEINLTELNDELFFGLSTGDEIGIWLCEKYPHLCKK